MSRKIDATRDFLTFNETVDEIQHFLEAAINHILYIRQIYPHDLFEKRQKYSAPVYQARHPLLINYIASLVQAVRDELFNGTLSRLSLIFFSPSEPEVPLETFNFDFNWLVKDIQDFVGDSDAAQTRRQQKPMKDGMLRCNLDLFLRAFILKISTMEANLADLPTDVSFTAVMELADDVEAPFSFTKSDKQKTAYKDDGEPWVPAPQQRATTQDDNMSGDNVPQSAMQPVKTVDLGLIQLNLTVSESRHKVKGLGLLA
ncbi:DNA-binding protein [Atractiella rhizophila]|nr:DNA-binding protein [Atractiella rhizophila]